MSACQWTDWIAAPTPEPTVETACAWQWATQPLPDVTAQLTQAMANVPGATVSASAYGENCLNADNSIRSFAAMETDYILVASADRLADALTTLIIEAQQGRAGTKPGRITLTVDSAAPVQVPFDAAENAVAQGLRGDALMRALRGT